MVGRWGYIDLMAGETAPGLAPAEQINASPGRSDSERGTVRVRFASGKVIKAVTLIPRGHRDAPPSDANLVEVRRSAGFGLACETRAPNCNVQIR
jgi:hypothetical protein